MNAKDLARDNRSDREGVEYIDKRLPGFDVCAAFTFVVESIDYCQLLSYDEDVPLVTFAHS